MNKLLKNNHVSNKTNTTDFSSFHTKHHIEGYSEAKISLTYQNFIQSIPLCMTACSYRAQALREIMPGLKLYIMKQTNIMSDASMDSVWFDGCFIIL